MSFIHKLGKLMFKWVDFNENYGRKVIVDFAGKGKPIEVLDLGAGHGDDLLGIKKANPKASLYAIEGYETYAKKLEKKGIQTFNIDIEKNKFPFKSESIDLIVCNQVLEHTKEIFWILHECSRCLKVGGKIIIGVPNLAAWHNRVILLVGKTPPCIELEGNHVRGFTKKNLIKFVLQSSNCYSLERKSGVGFYPFPKLLSRFFAFLLPNFAWGIFLSFVKKTKYENGFLKEAEKRLETNFYF